MEQYNPKKFKKFKKVPLALAVLFLAISVVGFYFLYKQINAVEAESHKVMTEWQQENTRRDEIRSLERSLKEVAPEKAELETHFAESTNVVPFLDTLEVLAEKAGAEAEVTTVEILKDKAELAVSLQADGSFESLYKFLRLLENSPYEITIDGFKLEKPLVGESFEGTSWMGLFKIRLLSFTK